MTLWQRELVRFWRQKSRVLGVVASPLLFWLVIGLGSGRLEFYFPGSLVLTIMFSAIFSTISIIEDRREGFLLSMLVSPAPRSSMVLGKILGAATLASVQGLIFLAFAPLAGIPLAASKAPALVLVVFLVAFVLTALGFLIAWKMDSTQGFHAVMNLFLVPMWMLSGALFTLAEAHQVIRWIMRANPLTYPVALLRGLLTPGSSGGSPQAFTSLLVTVAFGAALLEQRMKLRFLFRSLMAAALWLVGCGRQEPLPVYSQVPDFSLTSESGAPVGRQMFEGSIWVADFIFTNCSGPCPRMSALMRHVQAAAPEVKLASFTVDPERDTPEVLAQYARRYHAQAGRWVFLTGEEARIHQLAREGFKLGSVDGSLTHSTRFVLVDIRGRIRGYYGTGENDGVTRLVRDIRRLARDE